MNDDLCLLIPVWPSYQWLAPIMATQLERFWPGHPPIRFCGMSAEAAGSLPHYPRKAGLSKTNWSALLADGVEAARAEGFRLAYLLAEEHLPLAPCHERHLNETLPALMESMPAVYISLMGWDNRRYTSRSPVLGVAQHRFKHLIGHRDPRFHLHPALWRLDVLAACCELALRDPEKNGSAWHFEKINDLDDAPHPTDWKKQCYQICAAALRRDTPGALKLKAEAMERFAYHKLMAVYPLIPNRDLANRFARAVGFDDFLCDGPYPMFYSGVMAKGTVNAYFRRFVADRDPALLDRILTAKEKQ